ncbi:hypothetical protein VTJ83DRAFT_6757 [Remersonia thermophila]|uniref:CID domain-containing protein n=1 Tax=Remersonia thermophila TaxID=72144 RepID=A0ABR4D5M7_9PEZI
MADNAADVAEDYRQALEDLQGNSRIEIATLTNIARENANHGFAIAEALANHIKKVPPTRTLPALYVLDSIVKNVPTPYALYFGPKLYSIFMGAYTKVDNATRRKMDEMLKTWKEPVPGSISTKPVFPPELVRPIEHALMAARNAAMAATQNSYQGQQQLMRGRQPAPNRDTPTPPGGRPYPPPQQQQQQPPYAGRPDAGPQPYPAPHSNGPNALPHRATPQPAPPAGYPPYQQPAGPAYGAPQPAISVEQLKDDIQQLIIAEKAEFAQNPHDTSKQTKLKALLDLQTVIQSQTMPQDQLKIIKDRLAELAVKLRPPPPQQPQPAASARAPVPVTGPPAPAYPVGVPPYTAGTPTPPIVASQPPNAVPPASTAAAVVAAALGRPPSAVAAAATTPATHTPPPSSLPHHPPPPAAAAPPPGGGGVTLDSLFGQGAFATLLSAARKSATPPVIPPPPQQQQPPPQQQPPLPSTTPPVLGPAAAAAIAAALRSSQPQQQPLPMPQPSHQQQQQPLSAAVPPSSDPSSLLAILRQSGLLKPAGSSSTTATPPLAIPTMPGDAGVPNLDPASLKIFRPHLIPQLYEELGPPCTQCGRRFKTDEDGRRRKTAHMDWHFRVHQRMAEAERRGQHRSWYVDETDWIRSREAIDTDYTAPEPSAYADPLSQPLPGDLSSKLGIALPSAGASAAATPSAAGGAPNASSRTTTPYIPVPEDSSRVNSSCPICLERFEMKWLDDAQEWVWMDAVRVEGRVFHASCHREAYGGSTESRPGSVLGKRKAEGQDEAGGLKGRIKTEGY